MIVEAVGIWIRNCIFCIRNRFIDIKDRFKMKHMEVISVTDIIICKIICFVL